MIAPVSVCMIVKNEEHQIGNCLKSIRPFVAEICVVDTGSIDSTPDIVRPLVDKFETFTGCNGPDGRIENFSMARQRAFNMATKEWAMWVDGDDEVVGAENLRSIVESHEAARGGAPRLIMFPYEYSHDQHGNVTCLHWRERLVAPASKFEWIGPVHEVLVPKQAGTVTVQTDSVRIVHRRDVTKKPMEQNRNLRILKANYEKVGESDVRQLYYLGLEYGNSGDLGMSIRFHKRYVELSGWEDERFLACIKIAEHYQAMRDFYSAVEWGLKAMTIREGWAEAYFSLAKSYYLMAWNGTQDERRNWERCVYFARRGLAEPVSQTVLFINPLERTYDIHRFLNYALNKIGDVRGALESAVTGLSARPDDAGLIANARIYEVFLAKHTVSTSSRRLLELGEMSPDVESSIQDGLRLKPVPVPTATEVPRRDVQTSSPVVKPSDGLNIVIYTGHAPETWNPDTMRASGLGGSETAVVEMSKRLVSRGHNVRVFGDCKGKEGVFEGVDFLHYDRYKGVDCDVLIASRRPQALDDEYEAKCKASLCWVHDVGCGPALTHSRALRVDRFLCLSQWHKGHFLGVHKCVHPDQVIVTRNGIDLSRFDKLVVRNPLRAVYSSSPDRGMEVVVRLWPNVRARVPGAELHVFYGFHNWEVAAASVGDQGQLDLIGRLKQMLSDYGQHGVHFHGRVDQVRLAEEFLASGVWAYSTWFSETSCLTAMEAQAAGLRIVTSPIAALNETVGDRGAMIPGDWLSADYAIGFENAVVEALQRGEDKEFRASQQAYARANFGLDALADEWDLMLRKVLEEVSRDIVPPYRSTW